MKVLFQKKKIDPYIELKNFHLLINHQDQSNHLLEK